MSFQKRGGLSDAKTETKSIDATKHVADVAFDRSLILAVPLQIYESAKYPGRGGSIFDGKLDSFDAFDEIWTEQPAIPHDGYLASYVTAVDLCLQGIAVVEELSITEQAGAFRLNKQAQGGGEDEGNDNGPDIPDEQEGVRRIPGGGV